MHSFYVAETVKIYCKNNEWKEMLSDFYDLVDCQPSKFLPKNSDPQFKKGKDGQLQKKYSQNRDIRICRYMTHKCSFPIMGPYIF